MNGRRSYSRHGLNSLKARVKVRGLGAIDMRTTAARGLLAFRDHLVSDLGGHDELSTQRAALVDLATRTKLFLDEIDSWLLAQDSLVMKRRRTLVPVLEQRMRMADSLARLLGQLGLEKACPVDDDLDEAEDDGAVVGDP